MPDPTPTRLDSVVHSGPADTVSPRPDPADLLAGRYQILEPVAEGGMGAVLRCRDHALNRDLAIKVLHERYRDRDDVRRRFLEEAQVTGQLQHPAIVPVHEVGTLPDGRPFFAMKLVKGRTLADLLNERADPAQDRTRFLAVFLQICQAVAYAHSKGVIHRDLKPANVMVGAFGEVQVMDWGLAKVLGWESVLPEVEAAGSVVETVRTGDGGLGTAAGSVLGTYAYMPPEQARGEVGTLDRRCDVFGLGAVLCEILTGKPPYTGTREELRAFAQLGHLQAVLERLDGCRADAELVSLAKGCLRPQRDDRPADAAAVVRATADYLAAAEARLREAERKEAAAAARAEEAERTRRVAEAKAVLERRARRLTLGLAAAALLLVAAGGTVAWVAQGQYADGLARHQAAVEKTEAAMAQVRDKVRLGWSANDVGLLEQALGDADRAIDVAAGAGDEVRAEAAVLRREVEDKLVRARKNSDLIAALLDVTEPRETKSYERGDGGVMMAVVQPSVDDQFAAAFRRWGCDIDRDPPEKVLAKLQDLPEPVRLEVVAGLDEWALERRRQDRPQGDWRQPHNLADRLDGEAGRREVRRLRVSGVLQEERGLVELARALAGSFGLLALSEGPNVHRLRELAGRVDPLREPVLGVVVLARALNVAGENRHAEGVLRSALAARPGEVVLLDALGHFLEEQGPPRWGEATECYRAARALRPQLGIALGRVLGKAGRVAEREEVLRDLVRRQPNNPELHFYLGVVLADQQKLAEAVAAWRKAIELKPDYADAYYNFGVVLRKQKKSGQAEAAYRKAIELKPDFPEAYNNLGNALRERKKLAEAEAACRKAIELRPDDADGYTNLGNALAEQKKLAEVEAAFRKAIELKPGSSEAYTSLGNALRERKKLAEAEAACRKAIELRPDDADAYNNLGAALAEQKKPAEAEAAYRKAIELKPDFSEAYNNLGVTLRQQKKPVEAEAAFRKAIELRPDYSNAYTSLGNALADQQKLAEAEAAYRKVIELKPDFPEAYNNLGVTLRQQKKPVEAEAAFRKAIELRPDYSNAYTSLGNALADQQKLAEAEAAYRKVIELKPDFPEAYNNLGVTLRQQKKPVEAEAAFRKAIELKSDYPNAHIYLGNALAEQKKLAEAEAAYRKAVELKPDDAVAYYNLGTALREQQKPAEAEAAYRKVIEFKPNDADAYTNLGAALTEQQRPVEAEAAFRKAIALQPKHAQAHGTLGQVLLQRGQYAEARDATHRALELLPQNHPLRQAATQQLQMCERLLALETKLPDVLKGNAQPVDLNERLALADMCAGHKKFYAAAARFYAEAVDIQPDLVRDPGNGLRYNAACAAALAGSSKGEDAAKLEDKERARLRAQALEWLKADLALWDKFAASPDPKVRETLQKALKHWQTDADLAGVRDKDSLAKLPEAERDAWTKLWDDVAAVLKKASAEK